MSIVGVPFDDAIFCPGHDCCFVDSEASGRFRFGQHAAVAKPIVARAQRISMDEIGDAQRGEASFAVPWSSRCAGTKSLPVEDVCDLGIDTVIKELVDELDDRGRRFDLLRG